MPLALQEAEPRQQMLQRFGELRPEEGKNRQHTVKEHAKNKVTRQIKLIGCRP